MAMPGALQALPEIASRPAGGKSVTILSADNIARKTDPAAKYGARIAASCERYFPTHLHTLDPPPPALTLLGNAALTAWPTCAIVGARNASAAGGKIARAMTAAPGRAG